MMSDFPSISCPGIVARKFKASLDFNRKTTYTEVKINQLYAYFLIAWRSLV